MDNVVSPLGDSFFSRDRVVAEFVDQHGERRVVHKRKGTALRIKSLADTPALRLNRAAAVIIGGRIRQRRLASGLSLADLCIKAGLPAASPKARMREIEVGHRKEGMRIGTLYAIAGALNCEVSDLMPGVRELRAAAGVEERQIVTTVVS